MKVVLEGLGQTKANQLANGQVDTNSLQTGSTVRRISRNFDGLATSVASKDPNLNTDQLLSAIDATAQQNPGEAELQAADNALVEAIGQIDSLDGPSPFDTFSTGDWLGDLRESGALIGVGTTSQNGQDDSNPIITTGGGIEVNTEEDNGLSTGHQTGSATTAAAVGDDVIDGEGGGANPQDTADALSFAKQFVRGENDFDFEGYIAARTPSETSSGGGAIQSDVTSTLDYLAEIWKVISNADVAEEWTSGATSVGDGQSSKVLDSFASLAIGVAQGSSSEQVSKLGSIISTYNARMDQLDALKALSENQGEVSGRLLYVIGALETQTQGLVKSSLSALAEIADSNPDVREAFSTGDDFVRAATGYETFGAQQAVQQAAQQDSAATGGSNSGGDSNGQGDVGAQQESGFDFNDLNSAEQFSGSGGGRTKSAVNIVLDFLAKLWKLITGSTGSQAEAGSQAEVLGPTITSLANDVAGGSSTEQVNDLGNSLSELQDRVNQLIELQNLPADQTQYSQEVLQTKIDGLRTEIDGLLNSVYSGLGGIANDNPDVRQAFSTGDGFVRAVQQAAQQDSATGESDSAGGGSNGQDDVDGGLQGSTSTMDGQGDVTPTTTAGKDKYDQRTDLFEALAEAGLSGYLFGFQIKKPAGGDDECTRRRSHRMRLLLGCTTSINEDIETGGGIETVGGIKTGGLETGGIETGGIGTGGIETGGLETGGIETGGMGTGGIETGGIGTGGIETGGIGTGGIETGGIETGGIETGGIGTGGIKTGGIVTGGGGIIETSGAGGGSEIVEASVA